MKVKMLAEKIRNQIGNCVDLEVESEKRLVAYTNYRFRDGDHLSLVFKNDGDKWQISDEGETYMHLDLLGFDTKLLNKGSRKKILSETLKEFSIKDRLGELIIEPEISELGVSIANIIQAIIQISDIVYLNKERVKQTFLEDFRELILKNTPKERCHFNWYEERDLKRKYEVDCMINSMKMPLMIFAIQNESRALKSTITMMQFEKWNKEFKSIGIFKDMEGISQKTISKFSDVCEKTFSNIKEESTKEGISKYLAEAISNN